MISEAFAVDQLERLMGMVGFPRGKDAGSYIREMRIAVQSAQTEKIAEQAITDILREFRRCPAVADVYEAMTEGNARLQVPETFVEPHYRCARCKDSGYFGGNLPPHPFAGPWKWCDCPTARERRDREPDLVNNANAARETIAKNAGESTKRRARNLPIDPIRPLEQIYHGDF